MRFVWVLNLNRQLPNMVHDKYTSYLLIYRLFINKEILLTRPLSYEAWGTKYYFLWKLNSPAAALSRFGLAQRSFTSTKHYSFSSPQRATITPHLLYISSVSYNRPVSRYQSSSLVLNTLLLQFFSRELYTLLCSTFCITLQFVSLFSYNNSYRLDLVRDISVTCNPNHTTFKALRHL